jgi:hypothetical protein
MHSLCHSCTTLSGALPPLLTACGVTASVLLVQPAGSYAQQRFSCGRLLLRATLAGLCWCGSCHSPHPPTAMRPSPSALCCWLHVPRGRWGLIHVCVCVCSDVCIGD